MASREATINVKIADLPQVKEMLEAATAEIERLRAIVRELGWREPRDRPWMQHSPCDEAFERAFAPEEP